MAAIGEKKEVTGSHGIMTKADCLFDEVKADEADLFVLPGGMPGTKHLAAHEGLAALLKNAAADGKKVAAICAAPSVLGGLGILSGKKAACYPGFEENLIGADVQYDPVVVDGNVTTSRGMGTAIAFGLEIIAALLDRETADRLGEKIVYTV